MKNLLVFSLCIFFFCCKNDTQKKSIEPHLSLVCESNNPMNIDTLLGYSVHLVLDGEKNQLAKNFACEKFTKEEYKKHQIPSSAIDACGGWYGDSGEYFYIDKKPSGRYAIMYGQMYDKKETGKYDYTQLAEVKKNENGNYIFVPKHKIQDLVGVYTLGGHDNSWMLIISPKNEKEIQATYYEIDGMLPPVNALLKNRNIISGKVFEKFEVDFSDMVLNSDIGNGQYEKIFERQRFTFFYKKSHQEDVLRLTKDKNYDALLK